MMKVNSREEFDKLNVFGMGQENTAFAQYFTGNSYLNPLTVPGETAVFLANVTFEPGCRKLVQGFWLYIECIVLKIMEYSYRVHKA